MSQIIIEKEEIESIGNGSTATNQEVNVSEEIVGSNESKNEEAIEATVTNNEIVSEQHDPSSSNQKQSADVLVQDFQDKPNDECTKQEESHDIELGDNKESDNKKGSTEEEIKTNEVSKQEEPKEQFTISTTPDLALSDDEINVDDISSSEDESDSSPDDSSESDSSDSEEEEEDVPAAQDDDEEEDNIDEPIKSKHEVNEVAPTLPESYKIPENAPIEEIGSVIGLVENSMIIKAKTSGEFRVLKEESIFCFEDRNVIGPLFEIFGRVQQPVYRVKFNSEEEFEKFKGTMGKPVYYVVPDSGFLYTDSIKNLKGTDASNCHDEELPAEEQEFSDDEAELAAKQAKKKKNKNKKPIEKRQREPTVNVPKRHQPVASYSPINNARSSINDRRGYQNVHDYNDYSQQQSNTQPQQSQYGQPYLPHADQQYRQPEQINQYQGYQQPFQPPQPSFQPPLPSFQPPQPSFQQYQQPGYPFQQPTYQNQYYQQEYQPAPANTNQVDPSQLEQLKQLLLQQIQQNQNNPQH